MHHALSHASILVQPVAIDRRCACSSAPGWTRRKTVLFVVATNAILWGAIIFVGKQFI